jgi:formylglycine-generating enzyme required for sulfatase activity
MLAVRPGDQLTLDVTASGWFGYVRQEQERVHEATGRFEAETSILATAEVTRRRAAPLQLPSIHMIVRRESRQTPSREPRPESAKKLYPPLDEESLKAPSPVRLVGFEDLVPEARLVPALRKVLGSTSPGTIDVEHLVRRLASGDPLRRLPRRATARWHPELVVALDFSSRLWPYREDMHRLAEWLVRHVGRSRLSLRILEHGPFGPWSDWIKVNDRRGDAPDQPWQMPQPGTPVLIVSDLGMLLGAGSGVANAWAQFAGLLRHKQVRPVALVPLGASQLGEPIPHGLPILRWSPDARPHAVHAYGPPDRELEGLEDLLAMAAATRRVDPPLLRAMRQLNPEAPLNAGLEGALWCHPDVEAGWTAKIRTEAQDPHLERFRRLLPALQAKLDEMRRMHHAHLRALLNHEETLVWAAHAGEQAVEPVAERIEGAAEFFGRLDSTIEAADAAGARHWLDLAEGVVQRADTTMAERFREVLDPILKNVARARKEWRDPPKWADPDLLRDLIDPEQPARPHWLVQDAASGSLRLQDHPAELRQAAMGEPLLIDAGGLRVAGSAAAGPTWLSADTLPDRLAPLQEGGEIHIETSSESLIVAPVARPSGALSWGCDREGIFVQSPPFGRWDMRWSRDALRAVPHPRGGEAEDWMLEANTDERWSGLAERPPRVLISYVYDPEHHTRVLDLADRLRADGIDAQIDQSLLPGDNFPILIEARLAGADAVLMIFTEAYLRRFSQGANAGSGVSGFLDAGMIRLLRADTGAASQKFIPVLFSDTSPKQIPAPLRDRTYCGVDAANGYDALLRRLTEQCGTARSGKGTVRFGIEPRFGIYADLTIATEHGRASQRLRWIPPGTFLMGSPEDEPGSGEDEGPRHEVTISKGFWLFDTLCTQALWRAVMGANPSAFKSPDRPVERVGWHDAQTFLERINALFPGLNLVLPTEAQWEYACRAGTETAIYSGDIEVLGERNAPGLDPIAWYGGNSGVDFDLENGYDSSGWENKQYPHTRAGTRPVARKQPNAWGLYDMLGNVWEWCADGPRSYGGTPVADPVGPTGAGTSARVLRGGAWISSARHLRSAYHFWVEPTRCNFDLGFRCAQVQEGPGARRRTRGSIRRP